MEDMATADNGESRCRCGAEFFVVFQTCMIVNCPMCGSPVKTGACD